MIQPRSHLLNVERWVEREPSRQHKQRLDRNERNEPFSEAFVARVRSRLTGELMMTYPELEPVYDALAGWTGLKREQTLLHSGSDQAIKAVLETFIAPGDEVLLHEPGYSMYEVYGRMFDARVSWVRFDDELRLDWDAFVRKIQPGVRMVVVENPNGYAGVAPEPQVLEGIVRRAAECGAIALVDEAYHHFHDMTAQGWLDRYDNLIIVRTFSKALGLAGVRAGYILSHSRNIDLLRRVRPVYEISSLAVMIVTEMLACPDEYRSYVEHTRVNREAMLRAFSALGIATTESCANFVVARLGPAPVHAALREALHRHGILIRRPFHQEWLKEWVRINTAPPYVQETLFEELRRVLTKESSHGK